MKEQRTFHAILVDLVAANSREVQRRVGTELVDRIHREAHRLLIRQLEASDVEDVAGRVTLALWELSRDEARLETLRVRGDGYVVVMIKHAGTDVHRRHKRKSEGRQKLNNEVIATGDMAAASSSAASQVSPETAVGLLQDRLRPVIDQAVNSRLPRYQNDLKQAISEVFDLACGVIAMKDLATGKTEINKLQKRHSRARAALVDAVDDLVRDGKLSDEKAQNLLDIISKLRRSQTGQALSVLEPAGEPRS